MKKIFRSIIISLSGIFIITSCAQWGGDNPLGVTGGSEEGYGQNNDLNLPDNTDQRTIDPELLDNWINPQPDSYIELIFYANGNFRIIYDSYNTYPPFHYEVEGTYYTSGNTITLTIDGESKTSRYSIIGDQLLITINGQRMLFLRSREIIGINSKE